MLFLRYPHIHIFALCAPLLSPLRIYTSARYMLPQLLAHTHLCSMRASAVTAQPSQLCPHASILSQRASPLLSQLFAYKSLLYICFHSSSLIHIYALCAPPTCFHSSSHTYFCSIYASTAALSSHIHIYALCAPPTCCHSSSHIHVGPAELRRSSSEA